MSQDLQKQLEEAQAEIQRWKDRCDNLTNFNPDWDMLEATQCSLREHMKVESILQEGLKNIANRLTTEEGDQSFTEDELGIDYDEVIELEHDEMIELARDVLNRAQAVYTSNLVQPQDNTDE